MSKNCLRKKPTMAFCYQLSSRTMMESHFGHLLEENSSTVNPGAALLIKALLPHELVLPGNCSLSIGNATQEDPSPTRCSPSPLLFLIVMAAWKLTAGALSTCPCLVKMHTPLTHLHSHMPSINHNIIRSYAALSSLFCPSKRLD